MVDLEPYVGEVVLLMLSRPLPYVLKQGLQFAPLMVNKQLQPNEPPVQIPAMTELLQGKVEKRGNNYVMSYANPTKDGTRMSIAIDPKLVDAVYSHSGIAVVSPLVELPGIPGQ